MRHAAILLIAALLAPLSAAAQQGAADYPNRPIRIIVSAPPGGGPDIAGRIVAEQLRQKWGQPVIVENRQGNAGNLGAEAVASAAPDGYTLLASQPAPLSTSMHLYKKLNFDPAALVPVVIMTAFPNILIVRPNFPAANAPELIAYARTNPGKVNYASQGPGTTPHLTGEWFARATGTQLVHVPYRGTAQAVNDIVAGHVDMMFIELGAASALHSSGRAKVLAVASKERAPGLPDVPTLQDAGLRDFESSAWNALSAPPKTPREIVEKINAAINESFRSPELRAHFATINMHPVGGTTEATAAFVKAEVERWGSVIRTANVTVN